MELLARLQNLPREHVKKPHLNDLINNFPFVCNKK